MRLRLADGVAELVNAGHPAPYLLRNGRAEELDLAVQPPFGFGETGTKFSRSRSSQATGSSSSLTDSSTATRRQSISWRVSHARRHVIRVKSCANSQPTSWRSQRETSATMQRCSVWTGTGTQASETQPAVQAKGAPPLLDSLSPGASMRRATDARLTVAVLGLRGWERQ